jgi:hypothetical protein
MAAYFKALEIIVTSKIFEQWMWVGRIFGWSILVEERHGKID